jgi:hypothetical protein
MAHGYLGDGYEGHPEFEAEDPAANATLGTTSRRRGGRVAKGLALKGQGPISPR